MYEMCFTDESSRLFEVSGQKRKMRAVAGVKGVDELQSQVVTASGP